MRLLLAASFTAALLQAQDAKEIVRTYSERAASRVDRIKDYTYQLRIEKRQYAPGGKLRSNDVEEYEFLFQSGRPFVRVIGKSDQESLKEQQRIEQRMAKVRSHPGKSLVDRYDLQLEGVEEVNGRPAWVVTGRLRDRRLRTRIKLWIDQAEYEFARLEHETSFLAGGGTTHVVSEQTRMDDGVWLPAHSQSRLDSRLGPLPVGRWEVEATYSNYKKFQVDSRMVGAP